MKVSVRSDSMLAVDMVNQKINGPWVDQPVRSSIIDLLGRISHKEVRHVWREINQPADYMASVQLSSDFLLWRPPDFSSDLVGLIGADKEKKVVFR